MLGAERFVKGFQFVLADFFAIKGKGQRRRLRGIVKAIRISLVREKWKNPLEKGNERTRQQGPGKASAPAGETKFFRDILADGRFKPT